VNGQPIGRFSTAPLAASGWWLLHEPGTDTRLIMPMAAYVSMNKGQQQNIVGFVYKPHEAMNWLHAGINPTADTE
jgi:hypothetical protein